MRQRIGLFLGAVVIIAAAVGLVRYLSAGALPADLVVYEVVGEVRLAGPGRDAGHAKLGQALRVSDRVTTGAGSRAVLALGPDTRVRVGADASISVVALGEDVRLELEDGAVQAVVRPGSQSVRVGNRGREVAATNADFGVIIGDDGLMVVEPTRGVVLLGGVSEAAVEAGQRVVIRERAAEIGLIPSELLLRVAWPEAGVTRESSLRVVGSTAPGALVRATSAAGQVAARADGDGAFALEVGLNEGDNTVQLSAVDASGREVIVDGQLLKRDTRPPLLRGAVEYVP